MIVGLLGRAKIADDAGRVTCSFRTLGNEAFTDRDAVRGIVEGAAETGLVEIESLSGAEVSLRFPAFRRWQDAGRKAKEREAEKPADRANVQTCPDVSRVVPTDRQTDRHDKTDRRKPAGAGHPAPDSLPGDFPDQLKPTVETVLVTLQRVAGTKRAKPVHRLPVARAIQALPDRDHRREVGRFEQHWVFGTAERRPLKDVVMAFRNWLERSDRIAPKAVEPDRSGYDAHAVKVVL